MRSSQIAILLSLDPAVVQQRPWVGFRDGASIDDRCQLHRRTLQRL